MVDPFQQLLGNPNPLQALLQPQSSYTAMPSAAPSFDAPSASLDDVQGPGASGALEAITSALASGGAPGPSAMDEVPSATYEDHLAEAGDDPNAAGDVTAGLGPDLQQSMGLGAGTSAFGGAGGEGTTDPGIYTLGRGAMIAPPEAPVIDERSLYPSTKRSVLQGVIPGIAAIFAGMAGGKASAAALLQGANAGNQNYNQELKQRGLLRYQRSQQLYAREVALYNQNWQHAKDRAAMLADYAKKAAEFDDPDVAKQWLLTQRKIAAPFGVDPMDAMPGGVIPGMKQKIADNATKVYNDAVAQIRLNNPGDNFDIEKINAGHTIEFRGKRMTLGELAMLGHVAAPVPGAPSGVTSTKTDANSIYEDMLEGVRGTGREPDALERATMKLAALKQHAAAQKAPDSALDLQIKQANLAVLGLRAAKLRNEQAGGGSEADLSKLSTGQLRYGQQVKTSYEKASQPFNVRSQAYDTITSLASGPKSSEGDIAMVFSWMKMLDPTSTVREGEQAQVRNARGVPDSVRMMYNNLIGNTALSLTNKQKLEIVGGAQRLYSGLSKGQQKLYDNAMQQLNDFKIPPGAFLTPQGSVSDPAAYRTLTVPDDMRQMPSVKAKKAAAAAAAAAAAPIPAPAGGHVIDPRATLAAAPAAPTVTPRGGGAPVTPQAPKIVRKGGKTYQVLGVNPDGTLRAQRIDQYF